MKLLLLFLCFFILITFSEFSKAQTVGLTTTIVGDSDVYNRAKQENDRMMDPKLQSVPVERIIAANAYRNQVLTPAGLANKSVATANQAQASSLSWSERGPTNVGGRTRGLIFDLNDAANGYKKVFAGGVGGGLWVTSDITASPVSWNKINDFFDNIAVSFIAQDPKHPQIIYASTGESFGVYNSGLGIWKSTDGGQSWANLKSTNNFRYIASLVVDNYGSIYMAGHYYGIQKSSDGGQTWTQVIGSGYNTDGADLELAANGDLYAATGDFSNGQVYYSGMSMNGANQGNSGTWTTITPNTQGVVTSLDNDWLRIKLACAPSDPNTVYGLFEGVNSSYNISSVQRYNLSTNSWTVATVPTETFQNGQGWYALAIAVDPNNANTLLCGSLDAQKSTDGGATWNQLSWWYYGTSNPSYVHADHQTYVYAPGSSNRVIMGTDGGISYSSTMNASTPVFQSKNNGYNVTQFYAVASNPTNANYFLAGAQDNGTQKFTQTGLNATTAASGGDGGDVFIDQLTPNVQISSYIYNNHWITTDNWTTSTAVFFNQNGSFINPSDYDSKSKALYSGNTAGSYFLWNNVPAANVNDGVSVPVTNFQNARITAVTVAPLTTNRVYFGLNNGTVCVVDNANNKLTNTSILLSPAASSPNTSISCIAVDPSTENHLLVSYFNYGITSIYETKNALAASPTWTNVEGNIPDMPVRWVMFYPGDSTQALVATELGVWSTTSLNGSSTTWTPTNNGLANTRVDMLKYQPGSKTLAAATFGRGLFTAVLPDPAKTNQLISFIAPATQTYGGPDLSPGATSSNSTIPITYTSSNLAVGTITADGKFHILTAGSTILTASQAGSANYNAATSVTQTIIVKPAPLTITAASFTKLYLDSIPALSQSYAGFKNGDTTSSLTAIILPTTSAKSSAPVGTYSIIAGSATNPNYTFTAVNGMLTVNKAAQSLTFAAPATQTYGGPDLNPGATSTNTTTPITYTSSNAAVGTVTAGGKFHILTAGSTTLTASQASSANYNVATAVSQTLTVQPAPLTITATSFSKIYLDSLPAFSQSYAGFKNGDTTLSLTAIVKPTTSAKSSAPVGTYTIVAGSATNPNYTFTAVNGTLTVNKVTQSLSFRAPASQTYGGPDLNPGATSSNTTTPITYTSSNTAVGTITSGGKFHILTAGSTVLRASQASSGNYSAATSLTQTIIVKPAPLTITAASFTKLYLDSLPVLTQTYAGFKNGDTTSSLTAIVKPTTTAKSSSAVGMYTIVAGSATNPNYMFTAVNGTLTVNKAAQSLSFAAPASQTYGGPDLSPGATSTNTTMPITYTSSNAAVATVTGAGKVHILTAGITTLTASQAGSANYNAANSMSQNLTVQPALLTITAASFTKLYLDSIPVLTQTYAGFKNGDTTSSLTGIKLPTTTAKSSSPVGTYTIVAGSATNPNYSFMALNGTLTINKIPVPTISSINAATLVAGATELITGTYFRNTTSVSFGGTPASSFKILSPTSISAVIGAGSSGVVSLTTPSGTATFNGISFIPVPGITTPGLPDIQSGGNLVLSASPASGFAYQWYNNGTAIAGATSSSYTVSQGGSYSASISLNGLSQTSAATAISMTFALPATNFSIVNTSATCIGSSNGSILITAVQNQAYLASVTGAGFTGTAPFTSSTTFSALAAGSYQVCLTVPSQPGYQQCFTAIVAQPQDLSVYTAFDKASKILSLSLGGASAYFITLNGVQSVTTRSHLDLALSRGTNSLTVSTDKFCQGIISRKIIVSDEEQVFPNPFSTILNLNLGNTLLPLADIHIYSMNGNLVFAAQYLDQAGVVQLNLSALNSGIYLLKLSTGNDEKIFKIFKK